MITTQLGLLSLFLTIHVWCFTVVGELRRAGKKRQSQIDIPTHRPGPQSPPYYRIRPWRQQPSFSTRMDSRQPSASVVRRYDCKSGCSVFTLCTRYKDGASTWRRAGLCDSDVSVRLSVWTSVSHTPVLCLAQRK